MGLASPTSVPSVSDDASGNGLATEIASIVVIFVALVTVGLRFYTRIFTRLGLWWDDWLLLASALATLGVAATSLAGRPRK